jgi:hypothetical protein
MMKTDGIFEKARLTSVLIPVAGAVIAAALVLFAVFSAAYFGAFTSMEGQQDELTVGFDEPRMPEFDYKIKTVNENPASSIGIYVNTFNKKDGGIEYKIVIERMNTAAAIVTDARCMLYKDDVCIKSSTLANRIDLTEEKTVTLSGKEKTDDADAAVFFVIWEDEQGRQASKYIVKNIGG